MSLARPKSAIFSTYSSLTRTFLAAKSRCIHLLLARYSIPRATWYANETRSFCVRVLRSFGSCPIVGSYPEEGLWFRRKSRRLPWGANSTTTYSGPFWVQAPSKLIIFTCLPIIFIISISETRSIISVSVWPSVNKNIVYVQDVRHISSFSFPCNCILFSSLTFQHFYRHDAGYSGFTDVRLSYDDLTEGSLAQGVSKREIFPLQFPSAVQRQLVFRHVVAGIVLGDDGGLLLLDLHHRHQQLLFDRVLRVHQFLLLHDHLLGPLRYNRCPRRFYRE